MSERKVLNKYYPPDFDPSKIPRVKLPKNRQYTVRLMAPFNMRCVTCGEYIYKGKKFNARKEDVENEDYLGIRIYRFYIKCTRCLQEISFKTDPRNTDYEIEAGATRNFMALKLAEEQARREEEEAREEEATNPMKLLENRTQQSRNEIELLESLEELRDLNRRQQDVDYDTMLQQYDPTESIREREERLERQDEEYIKSVKFQSRPAGSGSLKRVAAEEIIEEIKQEPDGSGTRLAAVESTLPSTMSATAGGSKVKKLDNTSSSSSSFSIGVRKSSLSNLVVKKKQQQPLAAAAAGTTTTVTAPAAVDVEGVVVRTAKETENNPPIMGARGADKRTELSTSKTVGGTTTATSGNNSSAIVAVGSGTAVSGLGLLGAYSDSENSSDGNE
ncbi:splicing factor YJU2 [Toxorhynchites rutilus septentrionalis]|uniref:splicing factor YJU2 n=1 Tax=Toxorhynchites rutilus septentrionalis TaxID=329112 RepID=UPI002478A915|nr:splicing factor YJU2 [Toxorhynchites rutilus septentrionalis]